MTYLLLFLLSALTGWAQMRNAIVLPAGAENRQATILDIESWKPVGSPVVGAETYNAFTLPDGSRTYVVAKSSTSTVTVLGELGRGGPVLETIDLPGGSTDAALSPDGKRLLVVSMKEAVLTIIHTKTNRVMARVGLEAPANSVAVNFESTRAFVTLPGPSGRMMGIDLGPNTLLGTVKLAGELKAVNGLTLAPNGMLYFVAGELLHEVNPANLELIASSVPAPGVVGRPQFLFDGRQALLVSDVDPSTKAAALRLTELRETYAAPVFSRLGVSIDQVRIVSASRAIGYSSVDRSFYSIHLLPTLSVSPLPAWAALGREGVSGLGGTPEDPLNRYLFISSGQSVYRINPETNEVTASIRLGRPAGVAIAPPVPSKAAAARMFGFTPPQAFGLDGKTTLPLAMRVLDANGLPVGGKPMIFVNTQGDAGLIIPTYTNAHGYAQRSIGAGESLSARLGVWLHREFDGWKDLHLRVALDSKGMENQDWDSERVVVAEGDGQLVASDVEAPRPIRVQVSGKYGVDSGVTVAWRMVEGGGELRFAATVTDRAGIATNWYVGPPVTEPRRAKILASVGALKPAAISVVTIPAGARLSYTRERGQHVAGAVSYLLKNAVRYRATADGVPLAGVSLEVRPAELRGGVQCANAPLTDADGVAACDLFLGRGTGVEKVRVWMGGREAEELPITFRPGPPRRIVSVSGNRRYGRPGEILEPLVVLVEDGGGNLVNGGLVRWNGEVTDPVIASAPGTYPDPDRPSQIRSSDGVASMPMKAPSRGDLNTVSVSLVGDDFPPVRFEINQPATMTALDGDRQTVALGEAFPRPVLVELKDPRSYRPDMSGLPITFTATGGLLLSEPIVNTDANYRAEITVRAGEVPGTHKVIASAGGTLLATFTLTVTER